MQPVVSYDLWCGDSLDQFSGTIAGTAAPPSGVPTRRGHRPKETSVLLITPKRRVAGPPRAAVDPTAPASAVVYQLPVSLRAVSPMVWRRLLVTSDTTIARLHAIVQTALGWEDLHLQQFRIHGKRYGVHKGGGIWFDDDPHQVRLCDFRLRPGERFGYEYDLGDFWQHDLRLEQVLPRDPARRYPVCTAGAGDCPPEDCGGPPGYTALLAAYCAWPAWEQARADAAFVAERLLDWQQGGPRPTYDDEEFVAAFERMQARLADLPATFNRRAVNAALRQLK
jgi:hypothetical protein